MTVDNKSKKNKYIRIGIEQVSFNHYLFNSDRVSRSLSRIFFYVFFIFVLGAIIAGFLSNIPRLNWAAVLGTLFVLDYILHFRSSAFSIKSLLRGEVPKNNVAFCVDRESIHYSVNAFEKILSLGGDLNLAIIIELIDTKQVESALSKLDISIKDFKDKAEKELQNSINNSSKVSKSELLEQMKKIFWLAAINADFHGRHSVESDILFSSMMSIDDPYISKITDFFSISAQDVDSAIIFGKFSNSGWKIPLFTGGFGMKMVKIKPSRVNRTFTSRPTPLLDKFSQDMTDLARAGVEGFLIGHQKEYDQMVDVLSRQGSRNVLLIGEPGVGKESLVAHLALNIIADNVPKNLFDRRLVKFSIGDLISQSSESETSDVFAKIVREIVAAGNIILYIPEIHLLAEKSQSNSMQLYDFIMPVIKSDAFPVIGATYPKEYKEYIQNETGFSEVFESLNIGEISQQEAITLLTYDSLVMEKTYKVSINFSAVKQAVTLAEKYFNYKPLPANAREIFKEALASATQNGKKSINGDDIAEVVERKINVPIHKTGKEEAQTLLNLESIIHENYIDQDEAVSAVSEALRAYRSGLSRKGGPIATFLFVGPTGVGKTELSKILTEIQFGSDKFMVRFDMSEYQQKESISRFIGSSDGKIAGSLTEAIIQHPYSLILLDEFEKAHPDILNLFLQVFDDGRLTDSLGRVVDFQNTIIIATSNAQSVYIQEQIAAGKKIQDFSDDIKKKLFDYFKPELINRFSGVIVFKPLSQGDITSIAKINLDSLAKTLDESQGININFNQDVIEKIAALGYDPAFGARPLRRAIDEYIKSELSKKILSGEVFKGQSVDVSLDESDNFEFDVIQ